MKNFDIKEFVKEFRKEYSFLYNHDNVAGYQEAINYFDNNCKLYSDILKAYFEYTHDFISSDREAAAFSFTLEKLDLLIN